MASIAYQEQTGILNERMNWSAVWAGTFTFLAIWSVFGTLGLAIFASAANPNAASPVRSMGVGMGIWAIVLTIIAMWVGAQTTARLAHPASRGEGAVYGNTMFGLSVVSAMVITTLTGATLSGGTGASATSHAGVLSVVSGLGWAGFIALFLGWIAALGGASARIRSRVGTQNVTQMRPAA